LVGVLPNNEMLPLDALKADKGGFIPTDQETRTVIPGVMAAGDIRSKEVRQVINAAGEGATAVLAAENYLTNLYQADIIGKEDIKELYEVSSNQIFSTPYIVNRSLDKLSDKFDVVDPFILIDIGGATTDIHYSTDLVGDNLVLESGYDRLVLKKLGVYKSRQSLVFSAKNNEFVYELLNFLNVTENILEETSEKATKVLMQLAIFLVLYKVSSKHEGYITLDVERLNSIVFTGGITKVLGFEDMEEILHFFYKKILGFTQTPKVVIDSNYEIWTIGIKE